MVTLFQSIKKGRGFKKEIPEITRYKVVCYSVRSLSQHLLLLPLLLYLYVERIRQSKVSEKYRVILKYDSILERFSCFSFNKDYTC